MHEQDDAVISTNQRSRMFGCSERCCIRPFHYVITLQHSILNPDWLISTVFSCVRFRTACPNRVKNVIHEIDFHGPFSQEKIF